MNKSYTIEIIAPDWDVNDGTRHKADGQRIQLWTPAPGWREGALALGAYSRAVTRWLCEYKLLIDRDNPGTPPYYVSNAIPSDEAREIIAQRRWMELWLGSTGSARMVTGQVAPLFGPGPIP